MNFGNLPPLRTGLDLATITNLTSNTSNGIMSHNHQQQHHLHQQMTPQQFWASIASNHPMAPNNNRGLANIPLSASNVAAAAFSNFNKLMAMNNIPQPSLYQPSILPPPPPQNFFKISPSNFWQQSNNGSKFILPNLLHSFFMNNNLMANGSSNSNNILRPMNNTQQQSSNDNGSGNITTENMVVKRSNDSKSSVILIAL